MKKIFTILLAAGSVTFASAQSTQHNADWSKHDKESSRDIVLGNSKYNVNKNNTADYGSYSFGNRDRDEQIQRINQEFDAKIASVQRDHHLRSRQKAKQISMLEKQRDEQIKQVQMHFSDSRDRNFQGNDHGKNHKW